MWHSFRKVFAQCALWTSLAAPGASAGEAEFGERVRAYLLANPTVILEVFALLEEQEAGAEARRDLERIERHSEALFASHSPVIGGAEGKETLVEFVDYRCSYCRANAAILQDWLTDSEERQLVIKEFPILGQASVDMSETMLAIRVLYGDAAYADMHKLLMTYEGQPSVTVLKTLSDAARFDWAAVQALRKSKEVQTEISKVAELARTLEISGTPGFVTTQGIQRGFLSLDELEAWFAPKATETANLVDSE